MWQSFLRFYGGLSGKKSKRHDSRRRPRLEALENRCTPSAGALDPTFGNGAGYVTTSLTDGSDIARVALIQPDGKIVATGDVHPATGGNFGVVRYNTDGSLDTSFGSGGIAQANFGSTYPADNYAGAALQSDGKIVMAGWDRFPIGNRRNSVLPEGAFVLARFNANGTLDAGFGTGGEVTTLFPNISTSTSVYGGGGVVVTSTGKIVEAGDDGSQFILVRYNSNGTLDSNFGSGGEVFSHFPQFTKQRAGSLLQQPDGKLIVMGEAIAGTQDYCLLARYNADGSLDTSFGNQGIATTALSGGGNAAALYPNAGTGNDGKVVVLGYNQVVGTWEFIRFNASGSLDNAFGTGGVAITEVTGNPFGIALDASGRLVGTGESHLARFNVDGTLDTTFATGGAGRGIAIYPNAGTVYDDAIVAVGNTQSTTGNNFLAARYLATSSPGFSVIGIPAIVTAGVSSPFTVKAINADGSPNTAYTGTIHFTSHDPQAMLPADYTFNGTDQGVHTFAVTLKTAGNQLIAVSDTQSLVVNGSESVTVNAGAATHFSISAPTSIKSGTAFNLTVTALDAYGNVATGYTGTIRFTDSITGETLPGNYTFTSADAGTHVFTGLKLKTKGKQTLTVTDTLNGNIVGIWTITVG